MKKLRNLTIALIILSLGTGYALAEEKSCSSSSEKSSCSKEKSDK